MKKKKNLFLFHASLLAVCRDGLYETELTALMRREDDENTLPLALWVSLYSQIKVFLRIVVTKDNKLQLVHAETLQVVRQRYLPKNDDVIKVHSLLGAFFLSQSNVDAHRSTINEVPPLVNRRALSEVAHHLAAACRWGDLSGLLTDLIFVELRCKVGQVHELLRDYDRLLGNNNS